MMYPAGEFSIGGINLCHSTICVQGRPQAVHKGNTEDEESVPFPLSKHPATSHANVATQLIWVRIMHLLGHFHC